MSSAPLRVFLTIAEEKTLFELSLALGVPQRTRDRASAIRLSSMGWKIEKIAIYLKWSQETVRAAMNRDFLCGLKLYIHGRKLENKKELNKVKRREKD